VHLWASREIGSPPSTACPRSLATKTLFRPNFFVARDGCSLDWAFLGVRPLGSEPAPLVRAGATFRRAYRAHWKDLQQTAVAADRQGIADAGGDADGRPRAAPIRRIVGAALLAGLSCGSSSHAARRGRAPPDGGGAGHPV